MDKMAEMTNTTRRGLILGTAVGLSAVAVGGLSACSSGAGSANTRGTSGSGASTTPAAPAGSNTAPAGSTAPVVGTLARSSEVPVGSGKILTSEQMVITQPTAGEFVGLSGICTHQGCMVSSLRGASIVCGCHGSQFGLDGAVQKGPATKPLEKISVKVQGDNIIRG